MRILWICGLPHQVQREVLGNENFGAYAEWSWILGHLPPPAGIDLHIACRTARHTKPMDFSYQGARFHLVPVKMRARLLSLFQFDWLSFREVFTRVAPDVVHGWGTEDSYALTSIKLAPTRHVVQVQGNLNTYLKRVSMPCQVRVAALSERIALARARCVTAENEYSLNSAASMIRTHSRHIIEHPVRPEFLVAEPSANPSRLVVFVGSIDDRKGIWDAVEAFRGGSPLDWKMAIVGNGNSANVKKLKQLISHPGLTASITHYPQLTTANIITLMQSASVFLLPTRIDTGPTALKEALVMGLWPVCYDNSGPAHYIRKFGYGSLVDDLNLPALTRTLGQILQSEPWKQAAQYSKVQSLIRPHFDSKVIWEHLAKLYRDISEV